MNGRRRSWRLGVCLVAATSIVVTSAPGVRAAERPPRASSLPNLVPMAPMFVDTGPTPTGSALPVTVYLEPPSGPNALRFTTVMANRGSEALELLGLPSTDPQRAEAYQCVAWSSDVEHVCLEREAVGAMVLHHQHGHFHFEGFARYDLVRLRPNGQPDRSRAGVVATSPKVSFCLQDSDQVDEGAPGRYYDFCTGALQGISPGWADIYDSSLAGQSLPLAGVADGRYALVYTADPENRLRESNERDNVAFSIVEISAGGTQAKVVNG